jgi:hypothetical protein
MRNLMPLWSSSRRVLAGLALATIVSAPAAQAAILSYAVTFNGASESPANASPGTGTGSVVIDNVANTMHVHVDFTGLLGNTTASHIHAATAVAGLGTAGVATTTPTFPGFPLGVTAGTYDVVLDLTQASSYNASYVTANGGTPASAEAALLAAIAAGKAYWNIHTNVVPAGEIRGFLVPGGASPTTQATWGSVKSLYR